MALVRMKPPVGVSVGLGADDKLYYIDGQGFANVDSGSVTKLTAEGWVSAVPVAPEAPGNTFPVSASKTVTGGIEKLTSGEQSVMVADLLRRGSRLISGKPIIRAPKDTSGVLLSPNVTILPVVRNGRNCWEVTFPAEAINKSVYFPITSRTYTNKLSAVIEVENATEWNGGSWRLGLFTDINLTVGMRHVQTVGAGTGWNGFHQLAPLTSEWLAVGAGSFASTMTYCAFQAVRAASPVGTTRIWIYEIVEAAKNTLPSIIIGADDGHGTWYAEGLPILEKYGFSSYLAYIHDSAIAAGSSMSITQWQDAIARGHHAVIHGCKAGKSSLRDYFASYTGYPNPAAAIKADIEYNRDGMVAGGLDPDGRGRKFYVLPQGIHQPAGGAGDNTIINALGSAGVTTCRLAAVNNAIIANGGGSGQRMYVPIIGHSYNSGGEAANISALIATMQNEIGAGRSVIFMQHMVSGAPTLPEQITPANLELIVSAANDLVQSGAARRGKLTDLADELDTYAVPI